MQASYNADPELIQQLTNKDKQIKVLEKQNAEIMAQMAENNK